VLLTEGQNGVLAYVPVNGERADVAAVFHDDNLRRTGWQFEFPADSLSPGPHIIRAFAYDPETGRAVRLAGEFSI
jgi:hypothetical protein